MEIHNLETQIKDNQCDNIDSLLSEYIIISNDTLLDDDIVNINTIDENQEFNINQELKNKIIFFDTTKYIKKIIKSFDSNIAKINCQFNADFKRSKLCFNDKKVNDMPEIILLLEKYEYYDIVNANTKYPLDKIIMMLCTQASFAFSFLLMSKIYNDPKKDIYVMSNSIQYNISDVHDIIKIELVAIYNIKSIITGENINKIKVSTDIDLISEKDYKFGNLGIISWELLN